MRFAAPMMIACMAGVACPAVADSHITAPDEVTPIWRALGGSGVVRIDYFSASRQFDPIQNLLGVTAQLKVLPRLGANVDGKVELRLAKESIGRGGDTEGEVLEGYVTVHFENADLRLGKQIVAWGRADGINPTDNLTPRNFTVMLPFEDDQRFGTLAAKLDAYLSPAHVLTVFASPFFEASKIPLRAQGVTFIERPPGRTISNTAWGLRLNKVGEGFDWSISHFRGFSLLPSLRLAGMTPAGAVHELQYDRIHVLGADFARNFGRFGVRGEMAYVDTADDAGTDRQIKNPYLHWVAGVDRTFFESLNVNMQYFQRRVRHFQDPDRITDPFQRSVAIQNAVIGGQRDRVSNGMSVRISNKWFNETLEAELFAVANFTRKDHFVRPLLTYAFSDHWKGTIGAEFFHGTDDTQYGSLKRNRSVFAELRFGF